MKRNYSQTQNRGKTYSSARKTSGRFSKPNRDSFQEKTYTDEPYLWDSSAKMMFFVTTGKGCEEILVEEIGEAAEDFHFPAHDVKKGNGGVYVSGDHITAFGLNLTLMTASRVLWLLLEKRVPEQAREDWQTRVYHMAYDIAWEKIFSVEKTFFIKINNSEVDTHSATYNTKLLYGVKDALCDRFRDNYYQRPNVDETNADVIIHLRYVHEKLSISIDTTGVSLSQRDYRDDSQGAPLRESLAASLLRHSGWAQFARALSRTREPFYLRRAGTIDSQKAKIPKEWLFHPSFFDPMCGLGTLAIEAGLCLLQKKPHARREKFSFMNLHLFENEDNKSNKKTFEDFRTQVLKYEKKPQDIFQWIKEYNVVNNIETKNEFPIFASDINDHSLHLAQASAKKAGVNELITFSNQSVISCKPPAPQGLMVTNPPYGQRLGSEKDMLLMYEQFSDNWKKNFAHWNIWMISANDEAVKKISLRPTRKVSLFNGNLPCKLLQFIIYPLKEKYE